MVAENQQVLRCNVSNITIEQLQQLLKDERSFVLNIVANWCPDCTVRQVENLPLFARLLQENGLDLYNLVVQEHKGQFLSDAHQQLVTDLGGHGYPRTVLFEEGQAIDSDNVEVTTAVGLQHLVVRFQEIRKKPA